MRQRNINSILRKKAVEPPTCRAVLPMLEHRAEISLDDLRGRKLRLVPQGGLSPAADALRVAIKERGLDIEVTDYTDESTMMLSVLSGDAVAVTRAGSQALLPRGVKCIPIAFHTYANVEGLVYRSADKRRIAPVVEAARGYFSELG